MSFLGKVVGVLVWVVSFLFSLVFTSSAFYYFYMMFEGQGAYFENFVIDFGLNCVLLYVGLFMLNYLIYKPLKNKFFKK